jgi:2-amino-4-hydroxy-6-hydroxymethyldihydropteridine diphosphokinase
MVRAYLSIGSNVGREQNICSCVRHLREDFQHVTLSAVYETPAVGFAGDAFLNLVAGVETELAPEALRVYLHRLEDQHGRVRNGDKFSPRTLDVDLLLYGDDVQADQNLPHSDILKYPFVLFPLAECAPDLLHPTLHRSLASLAEASGLNRLSLTPVSLAGCQTA